MRIGIVEDECVWQHKIYNIINRCVHKKSINCEIIITISDSCKSINSTMGKNLLKINFIAFIIYRYCMSV